MCRIDRSCMMVRCNLRPSSLTDSGRRTVLLQLYILPSTTSKTSNIGVHLIYLRIGCFFKLLTCILHFFLHIILLHCSGGRFLKSCGSFTPAYVVDYWSPICSTCDVLANRRNIHHRPAVAFYVILADMAPDTKLQTYLLTYFACNIYCANN